MKFTDQQLTAIERRDSSILVSAGAGTGKTSVLVERFVRAVCDDGVDVASILAITFTEKAAAQLKQRVRARFVDLNEIGRARESEAAWISTIHGFCARVLRTHALAAGIDPEFRVLDAVEAERLALDAFDGALAEFLERGESAERLRMIAAYNPRKLADMVRTAYDHMRSQGKEPVLPVIDPPEPAGEREALQAAAAAAVAELGAPEQKTVIAALDKVERCAALLDRLAPGALAGHAEVKGLCPKGTAKALQGPAYAAYREAHAAYAALCLRQAEYLDHVLLRELIELHGTRYAKLKRDRSGLDFDDLELLARDLLRDDEGLRLHYAERFSHVLVDEFQDTNPLQNEILELLERENLFRVGDERQSIYRFRHADVKVFREHHDAGGAGGPGGGDRRELPQPRRGAGRHRPHVLRAVGRGVRPADRGARNARPAAAGGPVRGAARDRQGEEALGRGPRPRGGPVRPGHARRHAVARRRGAAAGQAGRRAHEGRPVRALRRGAAAARHHPHAHLRAGAGGARHPHLRARRPRLLEPAAGGRPAQLPRRPGQPARRAGALLGARLAPGRPVAGLARAHRRRGAAQELGPLANAHRPRGGDRPRARAGAAGRRRSPSGSRRSARWRRGSRWRR